MTQKIFDVFNKKDMVDIWDIVPDKINVIEKHFDTQFNRYCIGDKVVCDSDLIKINWHDKMKIARPIQEATEADIDKLCVFWDDNDVYYYGLLKRITIKENKKMYCYRGVAFCHCRRLTKTEIKELC